MNETLSGLLGVRPGVTALVGAGGKTTAMLTLAEELAQAGKRVIVTTTTHMFPPDEPRYGPVFSPEDTAGIAAALERTGLAVAAGPLDARGKLTGVSDKQVENFLTLAEYVLAEADGSRRLPCKTPGEKEPALPAQTGLVVAVLGLSSLGRPLEQVCFRAELAARRLETEPNQPVTPELLARLAAEPWGLAKGSEGRRFVILLNQSDLCEQADLHRVVRAVKETSSARVVSAALQKKEWKEESIC